jgi:hypothetical protein
VRGEGASRAGRTLGLAILVLDFVALAVKATEDDGAGIVTDLVLAGSATREPRGQSRRTGRGRGGLLRSISCLVAKTYAVHLLLADDLADHREGSEGWRRAVDLDCEQEEERVGRQPIWRMVGRACWRSDLIARADGPLSPIS